MYVSTHLHVDLYTDYGLPDYGRLYGHNEVEFSNDITNPPSPILEQAVSLWGKT